MAKIAVAPLVGARIEIFLEHLESLTDESLPSWERGLKSLNYPRAIRKRVVAPLVGARIEIPCGYCG